MPIEKVMATKGSTQGSMGKIGAGLALAFAVGGCVPPVATEGLTVADAPVVATASAPPAEPAVEKVPVSPMRRVSNREPNLKGRVFVVEYHHVAEGVGDYFRSPKAFRFDLKRLYDRGFRPCTVSEYLSGNYPMGPGATPVVFTFDDSHPDQLQLLPDGSVDPNCAVGIWMDFAKTHPDFPVKATFYVIPDTFFGQSRFRDKKIAILKSLGSELGSHTLTHPFLRRVPDLKVKKELAGAIDRLEAMGAELPVSLALPYGSSPKNRSLLKMFKFRGKIYRTKATFLAGANPAPVPGTPGFDAQRIPRIQAYGGPYGLAYWLKLADEGQVNLYVTK